MTVDEMEAFAADHGLAALLDHLGLDGLGNAVVELHVELNEARAEGERLRKALARLSAYVRDDARHRDLDEYPAAMLDAEALLEAKAPEKEETP